MCVGRSDVSLAILVKVAGSSEFRHEEFEEFETIRTSAFVSPRAETRRSYSARSFPRTIGREVREISLKQLTDSTTSSL